MIWISFLFECLASLLFLEAFLECPMILGHQWTVKKKTLRSCVQAQSLSTDEIIVEWSWWESNTLSEPPPPPNQAMEISSQETFIFFKKETSVFCLRSKYLDDKKRALKGGDPYHSCRLFQSPHDQTKSPPSWGLRINLICCPRWGCRLITGNLWYTKRSKYTVTQ